MVVEKLLLSARRYEHSQKSGANAGGGGGGGCDSATRNRRFRRQPLRRLPDAADSAPQLSANEGAALSMQLLLQPSSMDADDSEKGLSNDLSAENNPLAPLPLSATAIDAPGAPNAVDVGGAAGANLSLLTSDISAFQSAANTVASSPASAIDKFPSRRKSKKSVEKESQNTAQNLPSLPYALENTLFNRHYRNGVKSFSASAYAYATSSAAAANFAELLSGGAMAGAYNPFLYGGYNNNYFYHPQQQLPMNICSTAAAAAATANAALPSHSQLFPTAAVTENL